MARIEVRRLGPIGKAAWIPKGPTLAPGVDSGAALQGMLDHLRARGFLVAISDLYKQSTQPLPDGVPLLPNSPTAFVDLRLGRDALLAAIDSKTRYGIRAAEKARLIVEQSRSELDVSAFFALCAQLSEDKAFALPGSEALMQALCAGPAGAPVEARLFVARSEGKFAAGALTLRCGKSLHYMWGAMDRAFVKLHASEAIQWAVMQWGVGNGIETYDLEGIDTVNNPGTAKFKLKLGGVETAMPGRRAYALGPLGAIALRAGRWLGKI